jgi:hypothetical protein
MEVVGIRLPWVMRRDELWSNLSKDMAARKKDKDLV